MTSLHPPRDVISTRASIWRDTAEYSQLSSSRLDLLKPIESNTDTYTRLPRRRSIGPVWPHHRDREISALLDPSLATEDAPRRRQTEAIPIPESADASGLHRSQAWEFQASYDVRQERVRRRLQKAQQITEQYARECNRAGMNPCQYGWRMGHEHTGDCPRPALPSGAFCSWHTCTAMSHDGERCSNIVYKPEVLIKQGLFRVCRTGYHIENQQWPYLDQAIAHNQAVLAREAEQAPARDEEHLQRYAQITGETESIGGYTIYTQLNNDYASRKRSDMSRKPSALDLSTTSRRPSFSEQPTPLLTSRSAQSSADSTKLRTPVTPLPAKEWPLYTLDAALLKVQLDNACSQPPTPSIAVPKAASRLQPSPQIVAPLVKPSTRRDAGLSIEIIPVSADSPISPSPSNSQMRRASLSPVSAKPALPTVDEDEEGHSTPARSPSPRPLFSSSPLPIAMTSSRHASSAHLSVSHTLHASALLSASPASVSATSQLQLVLGQAKRTPATSVSIDWTSLGGTSRQSFCSAASHQTTSTATDSSAVEVVMPHIRLATGDECLTVKERLAARKVEGAKKVYGGGVRMAKMMRGRMGDGFMHRSAWGRTQQMDEDLLAVQPV